MAGRAGRFFELHYTAPEDRRTAVRRALRPLAAAVADALAAQNQRFAPSVLRDTNVAALRRGAPAVVTGQQVGLFLGPLYTVYKAASAVRVAHALADESGETVVPVFWLQTEDHDLAEISACHLGITPSGFCTVQAAASPANRISIEHCRLPENIDSCLSQMRGALSGLPNAEPHLARVERHYRRGQGWAEAFAGLLAELFAEEGLVLMDPRDPALAQACAPVHRQAIEDTEAIATTLSQRSSQLEAEGFDVAVHVRPNAPLSFFHPEGPEGPRYRLEAVSGGFAEVGGSRVHTQTSLYETLDRDPRRFSTSALLRPILQDFLLPTAAYVGGPGEVAYLAQVAPLYATYGLSMPVVVPRNRFRIVDEKTVRLLQRLNLDCEAAERSEDDILAAVRAGDTQRGDHEALAAGLLAPFDAALEAVRAKLEAIGGGMPTAVEKTRHSVAMAVAKLARKYEIARLHADEQLMQDVRRLQRLLYPNGTPQERFYGFSSFAARYGERAFIERLLESVSPFDPALRVLEPPKCP